MLEAFNRLPDDPGLLDPLADLGFGAEEGLSGFAPEEGEAAIVLSGRDRERFEWRLQQALTRAKNQMGTIHRNARHDRRVWRMLDRKQEYPGQPNLTTPISANKAEGLLAQVTNALEQRPMASFTAEGIGKPAEAAARVAPLCAAYLEREINRGGSRERLVKGLPREAIVVGTGIAKLAAVQAPSGEWFAQVAGIIPLEHFFVDRLRVENLKHTFSAYLERYPYYQLQEMADAGVLDSDQVASLLTASSAPEPSEAEKEVDFFEQDSQFMEEARVHTVYYCYMRFKPEGAQHAEIYEAVWHDEQKRLLACRLNPVREAFDHPPLQLVRVGKESGMLLGRGVIRRLTAVQRMADNAVNNHLAINDLAAAPPFLYNSNSPFGRLMEERRRLVPGMGIPTLGAPDRQDVVPLQFQNPGLALQDMAVAQQFADRATFTEEAIGTSSDRKTLGQFRVEVERGTNRVRLDLGDLAYDLSELLTMMWSMVVAYKIVPNGIVEVEEGGKFLAARTITTEMITDIMDETIMQQFQAGEIDAATILEFEQEFNERLTDGQVPSARRSDLTISMTGTKVIADKATELELLVELTPFILQGLELAAKDTYWNYHMRTVMEAMGLKDVDKRMPPDPGVAVDPDTRGQLGAGMSQMIATSSNMV